VVVDLNGASQNQVRAIQGVRMTLRKDF